jgi:hypothetical protein
VLEMGADGLWAVSGACFQDCRVVLMAHDSWAMSHGWGGGAREGRAGGKWQSVLVWGKVC